MFHATTKLMKETQKKKRRAMRQQSSWKKRRGSILRLLTAGAIRLPSQDIEIFPKKHKINNNNKIKLQNRMSPFPQRKIFWKQNIKPSKKCRLQHRKWEYAISKLAYKTSSLLRPEKKHATKILQCSLSRQETKGTCARNTDDCSAKGPEAMAGRVWFWSRRPRLEGTRSYGGLSFQCQCFLFFFFGEIRIFFDKEIAKWEIFGNFCFSSGNSANFSIVLCD